MALRDDMVAWYEMNEESGTRVDAHGSNDLVDNNTVGFTTGVQGNAANFVASSQESFNTTSDILTTNAFTISVWVNPDRTNVNETIFHKATHDANGDSTGAELRLLMLSSGNFQYGVGNGTAWVGAAVAHGMTAGTWYLITLQFDGDEVRLYRDTTELSATTSTFTRFQTTNSLYFGVRRRTAFDLYFDGQMDEAGFWDRAISTTEIAELVNSGNGLSYADTAGGASSSIKTFNGLAYASTKTVNGLAIASVKTKNGLA